MAVKELNQHWKKEYPLSLTKTEIPQEHTQWNKEFPVRVRLPKMKQNLQVSNDSVRDTETEITITELMSCSVPPFHFLLKA